MRRGVVLVQWERISEPPQNRIMIAELRKQRRLIGDWITCRGVLLDDGGALARICDLRPKFRVEIIRHL